MAVTTQQASARIVSQYSDKGSKAAQRDIAKLGKNFDAFAKKATKAFQAEQEITPIEEPVAPDAEKVTSEFKAHVYFAELF